MKRFVLVGLLSALPIFGSPPPGGSGGAKTSRSNYNPPDTTSQLIYQGFEGVGYDNGEVWNDNGTTVVNPDNSAHPAVDAQELELTRNSGSLPQVISPTFLDTTSFDFFFSLYITDVTTQNALVAFRSGSTEIADLYIRATGRLAIYDQSTFFQASPADALSANTQYFVWAHYDFVSGNCSLAFSTTQIKPSSGTKFDSLSAVLTTGVSVNNLILQNNVNPSSVFVDKIRVSTKTIGSNPL